MFSSEPQTSSLRLRAWGIGLGTIIMVGVPVMLVSAKTVQATLPILLAAAIAGALARGRYGSIIPRACPGALALLAFLLFAGLSALWAADPSASILIVLMGATIAAGSLVLGGLLRAEPRESALHMAEGLWIGLVVGLLYTIVEIASGQAIKLWVYNALALGPHQLEPDRYFTWDNGRLVAIHADDLTRNLFPIPLLIWPALMCASALPARTWRSLVCALLLISAVVAVFIGNNETAKIALPLGCVAFALARYSARLARIALSLAWLGACFGVIPAVLLLHRLGLHNADWLPLSARYRVTIWNKIAELIPEAPLLGVGADMTYSIRPVMRESPAGTALWSGLPITHPHNVYLQIWYELGLVGVLLFTALGLVLVRQLSNSDAAVRPFAAAMFATAATQIAFSYNVWQIWFMCLFGFAAALFALGHNIISGQHVR